MPPLTVGNLAACIGQSVVVVGAAALLLRAFGVTHPAVRLWTWRALLAALLLLPAVQPHVPPEPSMAPSPAPSAVTLGAFATATEPSASPGEGAVVARSAWPIEGMLLLVLAGGACARAAWLGVGVLALGRLRRKAQPLAPEPPAVAWAARAVETTAEIRTSPTLDLPVSFGLLAPVVVLPTAFLEFDESTQRAVVCHELLHVRHGHWLHVVCEEAVRSVLWFHPAVWWLVDQMQLAREQVVDREVVRLTGSRRDYVELLLRLAATDLAASPAVAAAFFRPSHVSQRIVLLLKENAMSTTRLSCSLAAVTLLVCSGAGVAASVLPLRGAPEPLPALNDLATTAGRSASLDAGPAAQAPVASAPAVTQATNVAAPAVVSKVPPAYPAAAAAAGVSGPVVLEVTCDPLGTPTTVHPLDGASELTAAAVDAMRRWRFEPAKDARTFVVGLNVVPADAVKPSTATPTRLGPGNTPPTKILDVQPKYPVAAKEAGVQGVVITTLTVGANGIVQDAQVVQSVPGLDAAALVAILQWRFTPTLVEGRAVPVIMTVTVNFRLKD